jgi:hypothetical protein
MINLPGVTVCNNRSHIVNVRSRLSLLRGHLPPRIPVFAVMQLLSLEQSLDLVGHGIVRVITKVGRHLVGRRQNRRARPARYIQDLLVRSLLGHLYGVNGAHYVRISISSKRFTSTAAYSYELAYSLPLSRSTD